MATIRDDIADAEDGFPTTVSTDLDSSTSSLTTFTTEADDPTEFEDYTGHPLGYTGWLKLVVPETALVTISVLTGSEPQDLTFWLYDEVPTASSVAVYFSDDDDPVETFWPYFPGIVLEAGTYYLMIAPYGGADWSTSDGGQLDVRVRWDPGAGAFDIDALVKKTWQYPSEAELPVLVGTSTATVDNDSDLTLAIPTGTAAGDMLVIATSWDRGGSSVRNLFVLSGDDPSRVTVMNQSVALNDHRLTIWAMTYTSGSSITLRVLNNFGTPVLTALAGSITTWRNASRVELLAAVTDATYGAGVHGTTQVTVSSSAANYGRDAQHMAIWAGGNSSDGYWDYSPNFLSDATATELFDATAASHANIVALEWVEPRTVIEQQFVIPYNVFDSSLRNEINLNALLWIHGPELRFRVDAHINPGSSVAFNAVIVDAISTKHDRTRYHYGVTPAENIVSTRTYGAFPPGTSLQEVLEGLDALITDLETQA